jgi:polyribonucleotide nucleotidyltransferase
MEKRVRIGDQDMIIETGRVARQADGSCLIRYGETVVLVTAVADRKPRGMKSFLPLTVDYREKTAAAGKIPGGFFKREGRPTETEILTCRIIDRSIRPLFAKGYNCETQVIGLVLSADPQNAPDVLTAVGASVALNLSDIPFAGPLATVRVGRIDGKLVANPTFEQIAVSDLDLVVSATREAICMVEGEANELSEKEIVDALMFAHECCLPLIEVQEDLMKSVGREKRAFTPHEIDEELVKKVRDWTGNRLQDALAIKEKLPRYRALDEVVDEIIERSRQEYPDLESMELDVHNVLDQIKRELMRGAIAKDKRRLDGRALDQTEYKKHFMLHYNFPPFSTGEVKFLRGPGRREIGHGALAERSLKRILPAHEEFSYTIRVVSEILESNGSSSMATVCGGSLSLMDAGVNIRKPIAGVAMGLIKEDNDYHVLTDILGDEDHQGDMDFKVAGSKDGITAIQMDIKIKGVDRQVLERALLQARDGRLHILSEMSKAISEPRSDLSPYAPRITTVKIKPERIKDIIGPGGRVIKDIVAQTGCSIDVEDDGTVRVGSADPEAAKRAVNMIKELTQEAEVGKLYLSTVQKIMDFGAFCEILPGTDGLLHISELSDKRVEKVTDILREGDEVLVKVVGIDRQGKIRLSRKEALGQQAEKK